MGKTYRAGTRKSPLALKQAEEVLQNIREFYPTFDAEIVGIDTYGDRDKITPISDIEGTDFFTREIEGALLKGEIDFAVHSAKDLPDEIREELYIAAITESIDHFDALVSKDNLLLKELPYNAKIGTSSKRRKTQLKSYRNDFVIVDIRGNIEERLRLLDCGVQHPAHSGGQDLDAIVVAACGLKRLGLEERITQRIPFEILKPHPLQGALAIETRESDKALIDLFSRLDRRRKK